jgi:hypothetical protein
VAACTWDMPEAELYARSHKRPCVRAEQKHITHPQEVAMVVLRPCIPFMNKVSVQSQLPSLYYAPVKSTRPDASMSVKRHDHLLSRLLPKTILS